MEDNILLFVVFGFFAQIVDGALGMAYGVSSNTFLLSIGIAPAAASASVHMAEIFTTGVSGFSHWRLKNVNRHLILRLIIPGVLGCVLGAYILTSVSGELLKPFISIYLIIMGLVIVWKAFRQSKVHQKVTSWIAPLGLVGGFFDAIGGGGWGPVVTTTLIARGNNPRYAIGSVNASEFFVTFAQSIMFILTIGLTYWKIILGLLIGGIIAAPLAAIVCKKLPVRTLMFIVGVLIIGLSIRTLILALA
ncbi:MAG: sulfite exporter TauE/SafE family protein [Chloroflexi bacterium]|nr:MAG: sulfite exporter TauE/SafE family protein [Chloroflexota bacterium]